MLALALARASCRLPEVGLEVRGALGVVARRRWRSRSCSGSASTRRRAACSSSSTSAWIPAYGIHYSLGIDGIALLLVALTSFLLPVVLLASWTDIHERVRSYLFFMLALQTGMLGAFLALNLFLFYVFWELMLIPMYFIIGIWGGPRRIYATLKFFIYTMVGSLLMLVGHRRAGLAAPAAVRLARPSSTTARTAATGILDLSIPTEGGAWWQRQGFLFGVFALAFAIKVPMFPFHTWLPDAHVEAPTPGSAVLAGVLLKLGTFGFVRYALPLFPQAALDVRAVDRRRSR